VRPGPRRSAVGPAWALAAALLLAPPAARAAEGGAHAPGPADTAAAPGASWQRTLDRVARAVLALRVGVTRSFDGLTAGDHTATGFVVDAQRGLVLTNRHVVTAGPVVAEGIFQSHEEVDLEPVYRDPVHDFGFFRFDPAEVRFTEPVELELAPERARVGTEIRVVGNDAGDQLSILSGTLARVDRPAPTYGSSGYSDFNTFYLQAASSTSGGSSGSPVVDRDGLVVGLNAGGKRFAASSYYLPLDRVVRALELLRRGQRPPRGTLQTVFAHRPFDELRRLGLAPATEAELRRALPEATGMLVVDQVLPQGPAEGVLEPGDVVLRAAGERVDGFLRLEEALDARVGGTVLLEVERGGQRLRRPLAVGDLHAITPASYLGFGGGVLNDLSYVQARRFGLPVGGVSVSWPGYVLERAGVPRGSVITHVAGRAVADVRAFERVMAAQPDGASLPVRSFPLQSPRTPEVSVLRVDRCWFPMEHCVRDDRSGHWPCTPSPPPPAAEPPEPATTDLASRAPGPAGRLARSLVSVETDIPYRLDGVHGERFHGAGLVVDAERGHVVVDRETVPIALGDVRLTFGRSVQVPGRVRWLHPEHNLAVVSYDPARLGDTPVESARLRPGKLEVGDELWLVGLSGRQRLVSRRTEVSRREPLSLPLPHPPRFRDHNLEVVSLADVEPTVGGVLADARGRVRALWVSYSRGSGGAVESFFAGVPAARLVEVLEPLREGRTPVWRSLGAELETLTLARARERGLPGPEARVLAEHDPEGRRAVAVRRLAAGAPAAQALRAGDLVLAAGGEPVTRFAELERAARRPRVDLRLLRDGRVVEMQVPTQALAGGGTDRAVLFAGALLQAPHRALSLQRGTPPEGVYVAWLWYGSPADRYGLRATRRILAVDDRPTPDLDALLAAVAAKRDRGPVRLRVVDLNGRPEVLTLKLDLRYWPTTELRRGPGGWVRRELERRPGEEVAAAGRAGAAARPGAPPRDGSGAPGPAGAIR